MKQMMRERQNHNKETDVERKNGVETLYMFQPTNRQTERGEVRKMDKAGGKGERQLVGEAKQKQREESETYYGHRLITMYSPTLTSTRLGHNTHT